MADALSPSRLIWLTICVVLVIGPQVSWCAPMKIETNKVNADVQSEFDKFKESPLFVEPFDPNVKSLPEMQLKLMRGLIERDIEFYKKIVDAIISPKYLQAFFPSSKLIMNYGWTMKKKLEEFTEADSKLSERIEPKPEFFLMLAEMGAKIIEQSRDRREKKDYSKENIDLEVFRVRANALIDYLKEVILASPMGAYLKLDEMELYTVTGLKKTRLIDEAIDLTAVSRP